MTSIKPSSGRRNDAHRGSRAQAWGLVRVGGEDRLVCAFRDQGGIGLAPAADVLASAPGRISTHRRPEVVIPLYDHAVRHEWITLPSLRGKKLARAANHHVRAAAAKTPGLVMSLAHIGHSPPNEFLIVSAPERLSVDLIERHRAAGYPVERVVSVGAALFGLVRALTDVSAESSATVLVHVSAEIGSVLFTLGDKILLSREFRMPQAAPAWQGAVETDEPPAVVELPALTEALREHVIAEVSRSLLFFNHELHGRAVGRVLVSSDLEGIEEIVAPCQARVGVPVLLTLDTLGIDPAGFGLDPAGRPRGHAWASAIACAVTGLLAQPDVDLSPPENRSRRRSGRTVAAVTTGLAAVAATIVLAQMGSFASLAEANRALTHAKHDGEATEAVIAEVAEIRATREAATALRAFLAEKNRSTEAAVEALRTLALNAPDSLAVTLLQVSADAGTPGGVPGGGVVIEVAGELGDSPEVSAQTTFNDFVSALEKQPPFEALEVAPFEMIPKGERSTLSFRLIARVATAAPPPHDEEG